MKYLTYLLQVSSEVSSAAVVCVYVPFSCAPWGSSLSSNSLIIAGCFCGGNKLHCAECQLAHLLCVCWISGDAAVLRFDHKVSPVSQRAYGFKPDGHFIFRFGASAVAYQAK